MAHDRRRAPRITLIASVEVIEPRGETWLKARICDLSVVGCFVETAISLSVGTEVKLHIANEDTDFTALGVVSRCEPNVGMGIRFTDVQLDQHEILERWVEELVDR